MPLRLKAQVSATQEDEGGVRSWSLEEPSTATRLRIYEDEYKMTTALDGTRSLAEAVQYLRQQGVVIGEPELTRFFRELVVMGLAEDTDTVAPKKAITPELAPDLESITRVTPLSRDALEPNPTERVSRVEDPSHAWRRDEPPLDPMTVLLGLSGPVEGQDAVLSASDAEQLKAEALASVGRGEIAHARDHLLVLFEALPKMPHVREALGLLETVGERPNNAELAGLVRQLSRWFVQSSSPASFLPGAKVARAQALGLEGRRTLETKRVLSVAPRSRFPRRRVLTFTALTLVVASVASSFFIDFASWFGPAAQAVTLLPVERRQLPNLSPLIATSVGPAEQAVLRAPSAGVVTCALAQGVRAHLGEVVARVRASPVRGDPSPSSGAGREDRLKKERLARKCEQLEALAARFEEARRQGVPTRLAPRDRARHLARARKVAAELAEVRAAQRSLGGLGLREAEKDSSDALIRASYDGEVIQRRKPGDRVRQGDAVATLARHGHVRVRYDRPLPGSRPGSEIELVVSGGSPVTGRYLPTPGAAEGAGFEAEIPDAAGALLHVAPKQFRVVVGYVADVMEIPRAALIRGVAGTNGLSLWQVVDGRLARVAVAEVGVAQGSDTTATVVGIGRPLPSALKLVTRAANVPDLSRLRERARVRQAGD